MTAVLGILNKQAVVIATDSAVTISSQNGQKIFNQANKLFSLSKYEPVGVMIYGNAEFMGIPWETIIKTYRQQLGKNSHKCLSDYKIDFVDFLQKQTFGLNEKQFNTWMLDRIFIETLDICNYLFETHAANIQGWVDGLNALRHKLIGESSWDIAFAKTFLREQKAEIDGLYQSIENNFSVSLNKTVKDSFGDFIAIMLASHNSVVEPTGLVFSGFGNEEFFPTLVAIEVHFMAKKKLKYYEIRKEKIGLNKPAAICPFAQTQEMEHFLLGSSAQNKQGMLDLVRGSLQGLRQKIAGMVGIPQELAQQILSDSDDDYIDDLAIAFRSASDLLLLEPLLQSVAVLPKEDLAEMAESLIHLTYLKRRISNQAETVGGAVDVAVITKGDGFIWLKRKQYFQPQLNRHFFDKYYIQGQDAE